MSSEARLLIKSMIALFELVLAVFLEKRTKKTDKNSSKPSSQTAKDESAKSSKGTKPSGREERDEEFFNSRTIEKTRVAKVQFCNTCGEDLAGTACVAHERRTKIDIVFEKRVEHVDAEIKTCPNCEVENKGRFPSDMAGPLQYGDGIKAYIITLVICQMIALNRVSKMVKTLIGSAISETSILKYILALHMSLEDWEKSSVEQLLKSKVTNVDETSLRVDKKNYWCHVYSSGDLTLKFLHRKRGKEAVDDIGVIPRYGGVTVHDCWSTYFSYSNCRHALCGSHILRELTFIVDSNGYKWAGNMKKLLQENCKIVSQRKSKKLTPAEYTNLQKRYRNILTRAEKELPAIPKRAKGKRGKIAKSDAHNLCERLRKHEEALLLFAKLSYVPFTNNRAERDLRMAKVKQKVSGCFRNTQYAHAYCRISSYIQTMANKGYNPLIAIQMALRGEINS